MWGSRDFRVDYSMTAGMQSETEVLISENRLCGMYWNSLPFPQLSPDTGCRRARGMRVVLDFWGGQVRSLWPADVSTLARERQLVAMGAPPR